MSAPSFKEFGRKLDQEKPAKISFKEFGRKLDEPSEEKFRPGAGGKAALRGLYKAAKEATKISPLTMGKLPGPISEEFLDESIQKLIGDPEAGFTEKVVERGVETLPYLFGGESALAAKIGRSGLAALLGQTAEEAGAGELAQTGAELIGLGLPGLRKKIIPKKGQQEVLEMLRRRGLAEKEIAPLIPGERKSSLLGKVGTRNFRTSKAAKRTRDSLGGLYAQMSEEGERLPILSSDRASILQSQLDEKLEKMPSSVRRAIREDLDDLFKRPVKANDLMNFWQDINSQINWKSIGGGKKRLNNLKDVLKEGIQDINPQLARDFELTNQQFSKFNKLYKNLKPESLDRWMALGEAGALLGGLFKFGPKGAAGVIGGDLLRRLSSEMLINPRLQNLSNQMIRALNNNKISIAKKIQDQMIKELKKQDIDLSIGEIADDFTERTPSYPD